MRSPLFSAKAEYACIAMLELAAQRTESNPIRLKDIADQHDIPKRFLVQILLQLKGAGLVSSARGAAGGYYLGRDPQNITLADIVGVIDRTEKPHELRVANLDGSLSPMARAIHGVWTEIQLAQQQLLEKTSLADLLQRSQAYDLMYQI